MKTKFNIGDVVKSRGGLVGAIVNIITQNRTPMTIYEVQIEENMIGRYTEEYITMVNPTKPEVDTTVVDWLSNEI